MYVHSRPHTYMCFTSRINFVIFEARVNLSIKDLGNDPLSPSPDVSGDTIGYGIVSRGSFVFTYADSCIQNSNRIRIASDRRLGQPIVSPRIVEISRRFRPVSFRLTTRLQEKSRCWYHSNGISK